MTKALKNMAENAVGQLIESQLYRAATAPKAPTHPLHLHLEPRAFGWGGGTPRLVSMPLTVTPFSLFGLKGGRG